ncbi:MAG: O-antigen ligase family protein, partial [Rectinemataceae bacterium]|nr:O-antigen ligase family protein [Rectinemataceae bacterium]
MSTTTIVRWIVIIALFTIPFLPLYVSSELFFPFITGKGFAFRILVEIALVAYAVLAILDKRYRPKFSWVLALFGGLVLWMAVANSFGVHPAKAFWSNFERMDGWVTLVHLFAFFLIAGSVLAIDKLWRRWWLYFVSVATVVCVHGVLQLMGAAEIHQGGVRVDASFGNAIYLAVYLMFSIFVAGWLAIRSSTQLRYWLIAFMALAFVILFYTASRGALIGLVAGASISGLLYLYLGLKDGNNAIRSTGFKIVTGLLVSLVVAGGAFYLLRDSTLVQGEPALARLSTVFSLSEELKVRSTIWGMAYDGVQEDPITGWGQEGFNQVFNKHYVPSLFEQETWFDRAHNMYIDWLVSGGFPALILFVVLLLAGIVALIRAPDVSRTERMLLVGAVVAYAVQALVVFDNLFSYVPFVVLLAMAHAASGRSIAFLEDLPEISNQSYAGILSAGGVVALVALVWVVNVPSIQGANHLVYAVSPLPQGAQANLEYFKRALNDGSFASQEIREQLSTFATRVAGDEKIPESLRKDIVELALAEMGKEVELSPNDARLRAQYAS